MGLLNLIKAFKSFNLLIFYASFETFFNRQQNISILYLSLFFRRMSSFFYETFLRFGKWRHR